MPAALVMSDSVPSGRVAPGRSLGGAAAGQAMRNVAAGTEQPRADPTDGTGETAQADEPMPGPGRRGRKLFREMNAATKRQHTTPLRAALSALYLGAAMAAYPDDLQLHYLGLMQIVREVQGG